MPMSKLQTGTIGTPTCSAMLLSTCGAFVDHINRPRPAFATILNENQRNSVGIRFKHFSKTKRASVLSIIIVSDRIIAKALIEVECHLAV
jgi:hypothetical protein